MLWITSSLFLPISFSNLDIVKSFTCLWQTIRWNGGRDAEISHRIKLAWSAFDRLYTLVKSSLPICLKSKTFSQCVLLILIYGSDTWCLNVRRMNRFRCASYVIQLFMTSIIYLYLYYIFVQIMMILISTFFHIFLRTLSYIYLYFQISFLFILYICIFTHLYKFNIINLDVFSLYRINYYVSLTYLPHHMMFTSVIFLVYKTLEQIIIQKNSIILFNNSKLVGFLSDLSGSASNFCVCKYWALSER